MNATGSLFPEENKEVPAKEISQPAPSKPVRVVVPFGKPDKSGRYWYERLIRDIKKLPKEPREQLEAMLLEWPDAHTHTVYTVLSRWYRANDLERDNYQEAMGR